VLLDALGAIFDLLGAALIGWRSLLGLASGAALAGALAWLRPARGSDVPALIVIVLLCYTVGLCWEYSAQRRRRGNGM
jgi:fermentation-respiration switch protein FrsA (DUF1100 family)